MSDKNYQDFSKICRENGWKCTSQRFAVYDFVRENFAHPGVDDVWENVKKNLPAVTRESVYRILNEFAERGIIRRLDLLECARYDCQTTPQGHFICEICGDIKDFAFPEGALASANAVSGDIRHIELRLSGICDRCKHLKSKGERKNGSSFDNQT